MTLKLLFLPTSSHMLIETFAKSISRNYKKKRFNQLKLKRFFIINYLASHPPSTASVNPLT